MDELPDYHLKVGEQGRPRLEFINELVNKATQYFLLESQLSPGMRVLDIGCGLGIMTCWIAKQVGDTGMVIAIDNSIEQLSIAKEVAKENQIKNIEFVHLSAHDITSLKLTFDFIYSRFLLVHLRNSAKLIQLIYELLNSEGIFACESAILGHEFCYPHSPAFDKWRRLNFDLFKAMDKEPQTGIKLPSMLWSAGFTKNLKSHLYQPVLHPGRERKEMILYDFIEQTPFFNRFGLINSTEAGELQFELEELVENPSYFVAGCQSCQVSAQKEE